MKRTKSPILIISLSKLERSILNINYGLIQLFFLKKITLKHFEKQKIAIDT